MLRRSAVLQLLLFFSLSLPLLVTAALPADAQVVVAEVLLDLDDDPGTGCMLETADGDFDGVEQLVQLEVDTALLDVADVLLSNCVDPGTNGFDVPVSVLGAPTPLGLGLGVGGASVAEAVLPTTAPAQQVRAGVRFGPAGDALITTDGTAGGEIIRFAASPGVPSLGVIGLALLAALLLLAAAAHLARRHPRAARLMIIVLLIGAAPAAWTMIVSDGQPVDWLAPPVATDLTDASPDLQALFAQIQDDGTIALRVDAFFHDGCRADPALSCSAAPDCVAAAMGTGTWACPSDGCCECAPGYSGANCDCQDGTCDPSNCPYQDGSGRAVCTCGGECVCINGFGGAQCATPPEACDPTGCNFANGGGICGGPWLPQPPSGTSNQCDCSPDWGEPETFCGCFIGDAGCQGPFRVQETCTENCLCAFAAPGEDPGNNEWCGLCPGEFQPWDGQQYLGGNDETVPCPEGFGG